VHGKFSLTDLAGSERGADVQVLSLDATNNPCDRRMGITLMSEGLLVAMGCTVRVLCGRGPDSAITEASKIIRCTPY
jgi:hypothetical protein